MFELTVQVVITRVFLFKGLLFSSIKFQIQNPFQKENPKLSQPCCCRWLLFVWNIKIERERVNLSEAATSDDGDDDDDVRRRRESWSKRPITPKRSARGLARSWTELGSEFRRQRRWLRGQCFFAYASSDYFIIQDNKRDLNWWRRS